MSARPIGSATVTFGLVNVPIRLYTAAEASPGVSFNLLHRKCGSRLKQQYCCTKDGDVVARDDQVRGFEFAKDQYVTFTDDELTALAQAASPAIGITEFVPLAKVDPVFFDRAYYVAPDKGGERAYALLAAALRKSGRCAIAQWSARGKEHLVLIRAGAAHGLVLQLLHYAGDVRAIEDLPLGDAAVTATELKLALQLVKKASSEEFRPAQYSDHARARVEAAIEVKVEGKETIVAAPPETPAPTADLMEALRSSLTGRARAVGRGRRRVA